jgi:hypothetical protein
VKKYGQMADSYGIVVHSGSVPAFAATLILIGRTRGVSGSCLTLFMRYKSKRYKK